MSQLTEDTNNEKPSLAISIGTPIMLVLPASLATYSLYAAFNGYVDPVIGVAGALGISACVAAIWLTLKHDEQYNQSK